MSWLSLPHHIHFNDVWAPFETCDFFFLTFLLFSSYVISNALSSLALEILLSLYPCRFFHPTRVLHASALILRTGRLLVHLSPIAQYIFHIFACQPCIWRVWHSSLLFIAFLSWSEMGGVFPFSLSITLVIILASTKTQTQFFTHLCHSYLLIAEIQNILEFVLIEVH